MEDKNNTLGDTFINGRMINLDSASVEDLERYLKEVEQAKENSMNKLNKLIDEIRNN